LSEAAFFSLPTTSSALYTVVVPGFVAINNTTGQKIVSPIAADFFRKLGPNYFFVKALTGLSKATFDGLLAGSDRTVGPINPTKQSDWHRLGTVHVDLHGFLLSPDFRALLDRGHYNPGAGTLWILSDGGAYHSTNGGSSFEPADNLATLSCLSVAGTAIAGKGVALSLNTGDNDGFYSMDAGNHWSYQQYGGGDNDCSFADPLRPHAMMVFTPRWDTAGNPSSARHGSTVSVYQTQPGNLPNASTSGHDRKAVTGPPTVPDDEPSRTIWNGSSLYGAQGSRPIVLGLLGEEAPAQGDYSEANDHVHRHTRRRPPPCPCPTRDGAHLQGLDSGGGPADADEQPRPGGRRGSRPARRLRRQR